MVSQDSLLVTLVKLVDRVPMPALPTKRGRGHPKVYPDRLFLKPTSCATRSQQAGDMRKSVDKRGEVL